MEGIYQWSCGNNDGNSCRNACNITAAKWERFTRIGKVEFRTMRNCHHPCVPFDNRDSSYLHGIVCGCIKAVSDIYLPIPVRNTRAAVPLCNNPFSKIQFFMMRSSYMISM